MSSYKKNIKRTVATILSHVGGISSNVFFVKGRVKLQDVVKAQEKFDRSVNFTFVHPPKKFKRVEPHPVDGKSHWKFVDGATGITESSEITYCGLIRNAKVYGPNAAVITGDNALVEDVSPELGKLSEDHTLLQTIRVAKPVFLKGVSFLLAGTDCSENFFHWTTDGLPKLAIAKKAGYDLGQMDHIIVNSISKPFQYDALKMLGIDMEKVVSLEENPYVSCEQLVVTSITCLSGNIPTWIVDFLRQSFGGWMMKDDRYFDKKIFVSRQKCGKRKLVNEDEVYARLQPAGFVKVYLEELSLEEQVKLFFNARVIAGTHGAGFTNVCFCRAGSQLIEFFPTSYVNQCYWNIASAAQLQYYYLVAEGKEYTSTDSHLVDGDLMLSTPQINHLEKLVCSHRQTQH